MLIFRYLLTGNSKEALILVLYSSLYLIKNFVFAELCCSHYKYKLIFNMEQQAAQNVPPVAKKSEK